MGVFTELRRRNIFRAVTIYAAGAWLLVQVDAFAPRVEPAAQVEKSIAVLPMSNGSKDAHEQYFPMGCRRT